MQVGRNSTSTYQSKVSPDLPTAVGLMMSVFETSTGQDTGTSTNYGKVSPDLPTAVGLVMSLFETSTGTITN